MVMSDFIVVKVDQAKLHQMKEHYSSYLIPDQGEYVYFHAIKEEVEIIGYLSKKSLQKATFRGKNALEEAKKWDENAEVKEKKESIQESWEYFGDQIGSDEVGVGDFLCPMIVVAAYVKKDQISLLKEYGIHDSKKMTDKKILEIGEIVTKEFEYSKLTLPNEKYNEMLLKGENLNSLKAKMHNRALLNLHHKHMDVVNIFVDEFVKGPTFYRYLNDNNEEIVPDIIFKTKGESYFPCVALASVIARYSFLKEIAKLEEKYGISFPHGASNKVNEVAKKLLEKVGIEEFDKIVKKNFANYREVTETKLV